MRVPSFVVHGTARSRSCESVCRRCRRSLWAKRVFVASSGSRYASPVSPFSASVRPSQPSSSSGPAITAAGIPMVRAMMAAWALGEPALVINPSTRLRSSVTISVGYSSSATKMAGPVRRSVSWGWPSSTLTTRRHASRISQARSRMYGSSSARIRPAKMPAARSTDAAAPAPTRI